jgi:hypothetical protein
MLAFKKRKKRFARNVFMGAGNAVVSRLSGAASQIKLVQGPDGNFGVEFG